MKALKFGMNREGLRCLNTDEETLQRKETKKIAWGMKIESRAPDSLQGRGGP